jgi:LPPG:FO 2-phospho-L-lactate transferase
MRICAIAGGVGSARFLSGLIRVVAPQDVTIVVNTGDDERMRGLHVSPDVDTVLYHLAGLTDWDRGWGIDDETFSSNDRYKELATRSGVTDADLQEWFALGDRDIATHMLRTRLLDAGATLSQAIDAVRRGLGVEVTVLPMSDDPVRTVVEVASGERLAFQEYFVRRGHADEVVAIAYTGAEDASAAPGVLDAIASADVLMIPPSNPLLSVGPVLAIPGVRQAVRSHPNTVAVSPIVGGRAIKGPADRILASFGNEVSAVGVSRLYEGIVDTFVIDEADSDAVPHIAGMDVLVADTIMSGPPAASRLCKEILSHVG